jgi:mediator of RNA polymerase II transcription subunit 31
MMSNSLPQQDITIADTSTSPPPPFPPDSDSELKYGGFTRFEIELEFVQTLSSPPYLNHLATLSYFSSPPFIAYLRYLLYWSTPPYIKYLTYPGPTLRHLELLQTERFRKDILSPEVVGRLVEEGLRASIRGVEST